MKYLLTFFVTIFFFTLTYQSAPAEFLSIDLVMIGFLLVVVVAGECFVARFLARYRLVENFALAAFTIFNICYLNLVLNAGFVGLPRYGQALALLTGAFIVATLLDMMDRSRQVAKILPTLFALASVGVVVAAVIALKPSTPAIAKKPGMTTAENIRLVSFTQKPNVYFVSFDSLIPEVLLKKHIGLETTDYHAVLNANFRRFRNFFADRIPSKPSLNSLLALDIGFYEQARENDTHENFFAGLQPSPLFEVFRQNNYETTTFYRGYFFGKTKGPFVDNYQLTDKRHARVIDWLNRADGACEFISTDGVRAPTFLGYCALAKSDFFKNLLFPGQQGESQADALLRHMRNGLTKTTPQVFVAYLYSPGHTPLHFDPEDKQELIAYRDDYRRQSRITASYLNKLVDFIQDEDPTAILYVFGDHGPYTSRGADVEKESVFVVQDTYGVYGGIFPKDRCKTAFSASKLDNQNFLTVSKVAHSVIRCLSDGADVFLTSKDLHLPDLKPGVSNRYEDYLYE